jgi:hypothetical protein
MIEKKFIWILEENEIATLRTVKVGVPKKVVFSKISTHVSMSNKSIS